MLLNPPNVYVRLSNTPLLLAMAAMSLGTTISWLPEQYNYGVPLLAQQEISRISGTAFVMARFNLCTSLKTLYFRLRFHFTLSHLFLKTPCASSGFRPTLWSAGYPFYLIYIYP